MRGFDQGAAQRLPWPREKANSSGWTNSESRMAGFTRGHSASPEWLKVLQGITKVEGVARCMVRAAVLYVYYDG